MFKQPFNLARGLAVALAVAGNAGALAAMPDLVPMPKLYEPTAGEFIVSGVPVYAEPGSRQCEIGAADVIARIGELGGAPGILAPATEMAAPGIYVLAAGGAAGAACIRELDLKVTAKDPGPQGYIIHPAGNRLLVIGSDAVGALYGAMTLRQMLRAAGSGRVEIAAARVYDKPDYRYRSAMSCGRGLRQWTFGETNALAGYRAGLDWLMRFKINLLTDYESLISSRADPRAISPETRTFVRELNRYAAERGIYPLLWRTTSIGVGRFDAESLEFRNWDCLAQAGPAGDIYYCWSRDDQARRNIARVMQLFNDCGFKILALHPVDGGGIVDPETWSRRCRECRRRFGNDRWRGSVHQYGLWLEAFKNAAPPDALFTSCIYPYNANYADFGNFKAPEALWRKNSLEYWRQVHAGIDPAAIPMSWMAHPAHMRVYRDIFAGRPLFIYAHSFIPAGYFGAWHRLNGSNYTGDPHDLFYIAAGNYQHDRWLNVICSGEYAWNTAAPGSAVFRGWYYDMERDHREPRVIFEEWVPRACRAFFGTELGELLAPVFQAGVLHAYIMNPYAALANANKQRRRPLADVNPEEPDSAGDAASAPELRDSAGRMAEQIDATARAWTALQSAYLRRAEVDAYRRRILVHYYRRMPLWRLTARARHAINAADECEKAGNPAGARRALSEGLINFEEDWRVAEQALEQTRDEKDMTPVPPLHKRGDIRPTPAELKRALEKRLAGVAAALKPAGQ